jgi:hypothetical protein
MVVQFLTTKVLPVAVATTAFTLYASSAQAFFPPIPVGSDVVTTPPVSPVVALPPPVVPPPVAPITPLPPPVVMAPPPPMRPVAPPPPIQHCAPNQVPEPATVITGIVGLSILGAGALRKKFGKKGSQENA